MSQYIGKYTSTCDLCICTKTQRHKPIGELQPLPIPDVPWHTISVDFIVELPESQGHDAAMVVVDSVTKIAHFVPTFITVSAARSARLFIQHVWKHHGLPKSSHLRPRSAVCSGIHKRTLSTTGNKSRSYYHVPSTRRWTDSGSS